MSKELNKLAKEFEKNEVTMIKKDLNLFGRNLVSELHPFVLEVERNAKKEKKSNVTIVALIKN